MITYLVYSLIAGIVCAAVNLVLFDAGLLAMLLWYVAGSWAGFIASVAVFLLIDAGRKPQMPHWQEGTPARHLG